MLPASSPLWVIAFFSLILALLFLIFAAVAFRRRRFLGGLSRVLSALLLLALGALSGVIAVAAAGYQALTGEQFAAQVQVSQEAPQRFELRFSLADGGYRQYSLAGDELYVDAKVLKWHPWANLLGLRTLYELDRVAGRYTLLDDELNQPRSVYALGSDKPLGWDLFAFVRRYPALQQLVDAEYGSGVFVVLEHDASYIITVSTSGLIARRLEP